MPGKLSTHVLDTMHGRPAGDLALSLWRQESHGWIEVLATRTNADGRTDGPLLGPDAMVAGTYELRFAVGPYFRGLGVDTGEPNFLEEVPVRFGLADTAAGYHVPLLVSPWSYSTYRGS